MLAMHNLKEIFIIMATRVSEDALQKISRQPVESGLRQLRETPARRDQRGAAIPKRIAPLPYTPLKAARA